jgi:hypothetical protein
MEGGQEGELADGSSGSANGFFAAEIGQNGQIGQNGSADRGFGRPQQTQGIHENCFFLTCCRYRRSAEIL